jgi:hypothetical protein
MKVTFIIYTKGKRTFLWDWNNVNIIPRKDDMIELTALGYGDKGVDKFAIVQNVLWKDKDNVEIILEF